MTDKEYKQLFGEDITRRKVTVYNREDFAENVRDIKDFPYNDYALIEIYSGPKGKPILSKDILDRYKDTIIALDFEDYPEDVIFPDSRYQPTNPTITYEDAERLVRFIYDNERAGKNFIVHCDAGVSRSQQVAEYILRTSRYTVYEYDEEKSTHTHHFYSTIVLSRLLEVKHRTIPHFTNKNNEFVYDRTIERWVPRKTNSNEVNKL